MPSVREHLIFKALVALDEVRQKSSAGPIEPNWSLRFCLAFLHTQATGDREPFDFYWREMRNLHPTSTDDGRYMRHLELGRALTGIIFRLGFNDTPRIQQCLHEARTGKAVEEFWAEVQTQLDDGRPMPTPRFRRG
jgi:hypothetical protein